MKRLITSPWRAGLLAISIACVCSCSLRSLERLEGPECREDDECVPGRCTEAGSCAPCPEEMALVRMPNDDAFCIDRYEATQAEYESFWRTEDPAAGPSGDEAPHISCSTGNRSFEPGKFSDPCEPNYDPSTTPDLPVVCVDYCDAFGYCASLGKRLCDVGLPPMFIGNPEADEWAQACAGPDGRKFPYADEALRGVCNVGDAAPGVVAGEEFADCVSPWGVHNLSGNVAEWTGACPDKREGRAVCAVVGGSYATGLDDASCTRSAAAGAEPVEHSLRREVGTHDPSIGIRCCMD